MRVTGALAIAPALYYWAPMRRFACALLLLACLAARLPAADKLNLNTATKQQLTAVGFSESQALQIIRHRQENGPFLQVEELLAVEQMRRDTFEKLHDRLTVDE